MRLGCRSRRCWDVVWSAVHCFRLSGLGSWSRAAQHGNGAGGRADEQSSPGSAAPSAKRKAAWYLGRFKSRTLPSPALRSGWRTFKRPGVDDFIRTMSQVGTHGGS